jgi:hypothetical protein
MDQIAPRIAVLLVAALSFAGCHNGGSSPDGGSNPDASDVSASDVGGDADSVTGQGDADTRDAAHTDVDEWPVEDGVWGEPENTFTLPEPDEQGKGLYYPDVQQTFSEVDWQTLDRLYIPAGHYPFIRIENLPERSADRPLVITNKGGQVRVGGLDHYYLFALGGGSNWVLTGRYDPVSKTGHADFPGHRGGAFAHSQGTYGILVDDDFMREGNSGVAIGKRATQFEVEYIEVREVGFAGMTIKTDDAGDAHMEDVLIHDNYIHDTGSEGFYIGSTQSQPQHQIRRFEVYNNRVLRTGTEAFQIGQVGDDTRIHHNVFGPSAIDWRAAFQAYQDGNLQISYRSGQLRVENNVFIGAGGTWAGIFGLDIAGDTREQGDGVFVEENYFTHTRNLGIYVNDTALDNSEYAIAGNIFRGYEFRRDEVYTDASPYGHLLRVFNSETPIEISANTWDGPDALCNCSIDSGSNISGGDNTESTTAPLEFAQSGLETGFNWLNLEMWSDVASLGDGQPVSYPKDFVVTHMGVPYRCVADTCQSGAVPPDHPDVWEKLEPFADDVRVVDSPGQLDVGLSSEL